MIPGVRVYPKEMNRVIDPGDLSKGIEPTTRPEQHLFMVENGYGRHVDGSWHVKPPGGGSRRLGDAFIVTVHADQTITVEGPPIVNTVREKWRLIRGVWHQVGAPEGGLAREIVEEATPEAAPPDPAQPPERFTIATLPPGVELSQPPAAPPETTAPPAAPPEEPPPAKQGPEGEMPPA